MSFFSGQFIGAPLRLAALLLAVLLAGAACTGTNDTSNTSGNESEAAESDSVESVDPDISDSPDNPDEMASVEPVPGGSRIADLITELPPAATGLPLAQDPARQPIGLTIESLGIDVATVIDVGVEPNGDMEIPPADEVGWYGFGPSPGELGSSVLAAHIAFDGQDGIFVNLDDIELGSVITVGYDDGTTADFEAVRKDQYDKKQLPRDSIFARDGEPQLVLITCGGDFNRQVRSYEDNVVIYANPINQR